MNSSKVSEKEAVILVQSLGSPAGTSDSEAEATSSSPPSTSKEEIVDSNDVTLADISASESEIANWSYNESTVINDRNTKVVLFTTLLPFMPKLVKHKVIPSKSFDKKRNTNKNQSAEKNTLKEALSDSSTGMLLQQSNLAGRDSTTLKNRHVGCLSGRQSESYIGAKDPSEAWKTLLELKSSLYDGIHASKSEDYTNKSPKNQSADKNELRNTVSGVSSSRLSHMSTFKRVVASVLNEKDTSTKCSTLTSFDKTDVRRCVIWKLPDHFNFTSSKSISNNTTRRKSMGNNGVRNTTLNSKLINDGTSHEYRNTYVRNSRSSFIERNEAGTPAYDPNNRGVGKLHNRHASERTKESWNDGKCDVTDANIQSRHVRDGKFIPKNKDVTVIYFNHRSVDDNDNDVVREFDENITLEKNDTYTLNNKDTSARLLKRRSVRKNEDTDTHTRSPLVDGGMTMPNNKDVSDSLEKHKYLNPKNITDTPQITTRINSGASASSKRSAQDKNTKRSEDKSKVVDANLRSISIKDSTYILKKKATSSRNSNLCSLDKNGMENPENAYRFLNDCATTSKNKGGSGRCLKQKSMDRRVIEEIVPTCRLANDDVTTPNTKDLSGQHSERQLTGKSCIAEADSSSKPTNNRSSILKNKSALHRSLKPRTLSIPSNMQVTTESLINNDNECIISINNNKELLVNHSVCKSVAFNDMEERATKSKLKNDSDSTVSITKVTEETSKPESVTCNITEIDQPTFKIDSNPTVSLIKVTEEKSKPESVTCTDITETDQPKFKNDSNSTVSITKVTEEKSKPESGTCTDITETDQPKFKNDSNSIVSIIKVTEEKSKPESVTCTDITETDQHANEEAYILKNSTTARTRSLGLDYVTTSVVGRDYVRNSSMNKKAMQNRSLNEMNIIVAANAALANVLPMFHRPEINRSTDDFEIAEDDNEALARLLSETPSAELMESILLQEENQALLFTPSTTELSADGLQANTSLDKKLRYMERETRKMHDDLDKLLQGYKKTMAETERDEHDLCQLSLDLRDVTLLDQMVATLEGQLECISLRKWRLTKGKESQVGLQL